MAKIIKLTQGDIVDLLAEFEKALREAKLSDGKITFSKTFGSVTRRAKVYFSEIAWLKMQTLIREFDKEVAWHGLAERLDNPEKDEYLIRDIIVYPQEVTGATVNTNQEKYQTWLMSHDDETFNAIRMQGHSHVNMTTNPSGVDLAWYDSILAQLDDTMFYIFMIYNKRGEKTVKIYDLAKNILFETADVDVEVLDDGPGLGAFLADAKGKVQNRTVVTPAVRTGAGSSYTYGGYNGYSGGYYSSAYNYSYKPETPAQQPAKQPEPAGAPALPEVKKPAETKEATQKSGNFTKKGRRKGKRKNRDRALSGYSPNNSYGSFYDDEDEEDDPFGPFGYRDTYLE